MKILKKKLLLAIPFVTLTFVCYQNFWLKNDSIKEKNNDRLEAYNALIEEFVNKNYQDKLPASGPDKANFRDFIMTVDVDKGFIPKENLYDLEKELRLNKRRKDDLRDFKW